MHMPKNPTPTSEKDIDDAVKGTFPASDPPSFMSGSTASPGEATLDALPKAAPTTTIYRVVAGTHRDKPFGMDAASRGGRWTSDDVPAVYASESAATALLEFLAHCDEAAPERVFLASAEVPADRIAKAAAYPPHWRERPYRDDVRRVGDEWARSHASLALQVPSALCEGACNLILNPSHVDAPLLQHVDVQEVRVDERLRRIGAG